MLSIVFKVLFRIKTPALLQKLDDKNIGRQFRAIKRQLWPMKIGPCVSLTLLRRGQVICTRAPCNAQRAPDARRLGTRHRCRRLA